MGNHERRDFGRTARRVLTSWFTFVALIALVTGLGIYGFRGLHHQVKQDAQRHAIDTAKIVGVLTVQRNIDATDLGSTTELSPKELSDLNGDVAVLRSQHRIVGLEVWRADGFLLYADENHSPLETHLPAAELARLPGDQNWISVASASEARETSTYNVMMPYDADHDHVPEAVVEVLLPRANIEGAVARTTRRLDVVALLFAAVMAVGIVVSRRRFAVRGYRASHDRLTGLQNWGALDDAVTTTIAAVRSQQSVAALLVIDLDDFRVVNNTLGHVAGDELLVQVGAEILRSVRDGDVVARLGGDEFAVLLRDLPDGTSAAHIAAQLLDHLRDGSFVVSGIELRVDASIGVAMIPAHGDEFAMLLRHGDVAMYQAKETGAGIAVYDWVTDHHDVDELALLGELRSAIDHDELVLHYQPKAGIRDREIIGAEALVRWQHPTRGLLPPAAFIALAESTALIGPLTRWVMRSAVHQAAAWWRDGVPLAIAVNVSPRSLLESDLVASVVALLAEAELPARLLEIEITETAIMTDLDRASSVLRELRAAGVRISVDDFGTGNTSLSHLKRLPVDMLKIDQSFIADMIEDDKGEAVTKSVIDLGHSLGLEVLAEGIETEASWRRLAELGCDEGQGFLLAKPMPAEEVAGWIAARRLRTVLASSALASSARSTTARSAPVLTSTGLTRAAG